MADDTKKPDDKTPEKDPAAMTEWEKRAAGEPFDSAKLYQEMDDDGIDAIMDGFKEGVVRRKAREAKPD